MSTIYFYHHLVVYTLKNATTNLPMPYPNFHIVRQLYILWTYYNVYRFVCIESLIYTFYFFAVEFHTIICKHCAFYNIGFSYKIGYKCTTFSVIIRTFQK